MSQLSLADRWGRRVGDRMCGPLAFYKFLSARGSVDLPSYGVFVRKHFPEFAAGRSGRVDAHGLRLETALDRLATFYPRAFLGYENRSLHRRARTRDLLRDFYRQLKASVRKRRPVILQIAAYSATVKGGKNIWSRELGHFIVIDHLDSPPDTDDPFCTLRYWDPWDGKQHRSVLYEEWYRDFSILRPERNLRRSPSGHQVQSPVLCLLAPHMDLYSPKTYFAQRYVFAVERALI